MSRRLWTIGVFVLALGLARQAWAAEPLDA